MIAVLAIGVSVPKLVLCMTYSTWLTGPINGMKPLLMVSVTQDKMSAMKRVYWSNTLVQIEISQHIYGV